MFTLFLPGIEVVAAEALPRMPALERLLVRARERPLDDSPWAVLADLAGGDTESWPVGPVSAFGDLEMPPRACLRVEPLGADAERQGMFRLPASALSIAREEAEALAAAFCATFEEDALKLEIATPERWYLAWDESGAGGRAWRGFPGPARSLDEHARPAPPEPALVRLLSEVEMLFHAQPLNAARRERNVPAIAGLHPWGGGMLPVSTLPSVARPSEIEEPYLAGLRRLGMLPGAPVARAGQGDIGAVGIAWPLAVEGLDVRQLAAIEQDWAMPLLAMLRRGRLGGVRIVTGRAVHEVRRTEALRFWRRPRPLAELC